MPEGIAPEPGNTKPATDEPSVSEEASQAPSESATPSESASESACPSASASAPGPAVHCAAAVDHPRSGWVADESLSPEVPTYLPGGKIKAVIVHHTAQSNTYTCAEAPSIISATYTYDVETLGWKGRGYNDLDLRRPLGRLGGLTGRHLERGSGLRRRQESDDCGPEIVENRSPERDLDRELVCPRKSHGQRL